MPNFHWQQANFPQEPVDGFFGIIPRNRLELIFDNETTNWRAWWSPRPAECMASAKSSPLSDAVLCRPRPRIVECFFRWIDPPFSTNMWMNKTSPIPKVWPFWDRYPSLIIIPLISQHKVIPKNESHIVGYCWLFPISPNNLYKWLVSCHHTHDIPCIA